MLLNCTLKMVKIKFYVIYIYSTLILKNEKVKSKCRVTHSKASPFPPCARSSGLLVALHTSLSQQFRQWVFFESPKCARHCAWHWRRTETPHACAQPKVSSGLSSSSASSIKKLLMSPGLHLPPRFLLPCYLSPHSSLPGVFPCTCWALPHELLCWAPLPHELLWGRGKSNFSTLHPSLHALRTQ